MDKIPSRYVYAAVHIEETTNCIISRSFFDMNGSKDTPLRCFIHRYSTSGLYAVELVLQSR